MKCFKVCTDGGCRDNPGPGAWGVVITQQDGDTRHFSGFLPMCTNNQAEYRALEAACLLLNNEETCGSKIEFFSDSQLVVEQISGRWKVNSAIAPFFSTASEAFNKLSKVCDVSISWVRRELNKEADLLCNMVMDKRGIVCTKASQ